MYIYHERQLGGLCGVHCLNNLLQGPHFGPGDLAEIGVHLDQQERALVRQATGEVGTGAEEYNVDSSADGGNFSIQVLSVALKRFELELVSSRHPNMKVAMKDPSEATEAFLCQSRDHWFAIRKVSEEWWNLNSTRKRPVKVGAFYLAAWLAQLEVEGNTIFVVLGRLPPLSVPAGSDKHLLENFHDLADLRRRAETSGGNPVAHEPDSEDEGAQWAQAMALAESEIECKPRISAEQACAGMREMGFKTNQIEIALRLASGDGEVASHFLVIMEPIEDRKVLEDPTSWAKLIQASVLGLDLDRASMEVLVQGMLRIATLLDSPQEVQQGAVDMVDLQVLSRFLRDVLRHHSKAWDTAVANAGEMLASLLSMGAMRQRGGAVDADDVVIRL